jgi:uncharacterized membrane protein YeaQ/YmgE (transglycosylase-associated protein family)
MHHIPVLIALIMSLICGYIAASMAAKDDPRGCITCVFHADR